MTVSPFIVKLTAGRHKDYILSIMELGKTRQIRGTDGALMKRATYASVSVACFLILLKFFAWLATDSVAILSTLVDSVLDALASLVTVLAIRHALTPADREHRFGHGKAEPLASVGQAAFIAGSATLVLFEASRRLWQPQPVNDSEIGIAVMLASILLTGILVIYQRYVVRKTGSIAIKGDSVHYFGDLLTNAAVIASLLVGQRLGWLALDPILGAAIACYLLFSAWQVARVALNMLMDHELPDQARKRIEQLALDHPDVAAIHDLRTRTSGPQQFIQFHLEMSGNLSLTRAHEVSDAVEAAVTTEFPDAEVIIHQDPTGLNEPHTRFT